MTTAVDPAIQARYDQSAAARRAESAEVSGEFKARQAQIAEQIKKDEEAVAALGRRIAESKVDTPPRLAKRPEDNDISAQASAYQEADDEPAPAPPPPAPPPKPRPVTRVPADEEEVPSFQWDDGPAAPTASSPPRSVAPAQPRRERPPASQDADEDLSEHDWLE